MDVDADRLYAECVRRHPEGATLAQRETIASELLAASAAPVASVGTHCNARGWFSDVPGRDDDPAPAADYPWQPCLQVESGLCLSFDIWHRTKDDCDRFIRDSILGQPMLDDD